MTRRQDLIPLADRPAWDALLSGIPPAYAHTWASCHAMHLTTGWPTYLYSWADGDARIVCPIAERGSPGQVDVVTPYGFGGFVGVGVDERAVDAWRHFAEERGYISGYVVLNPE